MMKISTPVIAKESLLNTVQFTSLNSVVFKNVKNVYNRNDKITLEYEHSNKITSSSKDWIGIFPHGWSKLQQYVALEWVSGSFPLASGKQNKENGDLVRRGIVFIPEFYMGYINTNSFYQFVYISKQIEVLGVSSYFRLDVNQANARSLDFECLVPVSGKLRSTSVSDFGIVLGNNLPSSTSIGTRTLQTSSIHSLQNLDEETKNRAKPSITLTGADVIKAAIYPRKSTETRDVLDPYTSHSEPVFPMSFQVAQSKKCVHSKRGGECMRSQQALQSKVGPRSAGSLEFGSRRRTLSNELSEDKLKIVMERNKVLEERAQKTKKEMERLQAESKKLKMSYYNTNKEKVAYEKFVKDFIKSLEKDSIVRVVNGNTEILVKKVNYVGIEEHPRGKKTSKRERELKAVIGLQEITIRNLINSLQEKAKSVKELNETVKLAQAFSSARADNKDYGSDAEEALDEISNSDVTSEYEFSLTKPQPPEEALVEDTDAVLDDIRRTTEMELKDIGINRSLGKSISRDSELNMPNLSVRSYHKENEGTRPKKPRLFDNLEDCWPFSEDTPKTVHKRILETSPRSQKEEDINESTTEPVASGEISKESNEEVNETHVELPHSELTEIQNSEKTGNMDDAAGCENYYDAFEDSESSTGSPEEMAIVQNDTQVDAEEKKNFLVTAIIPQDMNIKPVKKEDDWTVTAKDEPLEKKVESPVKRGKKFTCEFSIDFTSKRNTPNFETPDEEIPTSRALEYKEPEEVSNQICKQFDVVPSDIETGQDKPVVTFKQVNKRLEIKITQVDQKDNVASKNIVQQNVVLKFGKEFPAGATDETVTKPSKFEFNLALTGVGDSAKTSRPQTNNFPTEGLELEPPEDEIPEATPRTVWNDATEDVIEDEFPPETSPREEEVEEKEETVKKVETEASPSQKEADEEDEQSVTSEEESPESSSTNANMQTNEDSLRYEKNLEFLQQKTHERVSSEEDVAKNKPSAILIQNGQTKLALIRYQ